MELVPGPTLAQVIARGPVPVRTAIGYAIDISDALSVVHAAGIVLSDRRRHAHQARRAFRFSRDGSRLFGVRRGPAGRWELTIWDVEAGRELRALPLSLAPSADVQGMTLSSDESRIIVGAGTATSDIWLLEQFTPLSSWRERWFGGGR